VVVAAINGPQPKFPNDWSAYEEDELAAFQGQVQTIGTKFCCDAKSNCEVQVQFEAGDVYVDYSHNRTRFDDRTAGQVIINRFDLQKQMLVVNQTCKEYCPMQGDVLRPGFLDRNATDKGQVTLPDGRKAEHWQWKETIFGIIVMEICDVYVNQQDMQNGIPYGEVDHLTPFGQHIGDFTSTWTNFKPGTPDPSLFIVNGIDSCPMAHDCGNNAHQLARLRTHQNKAYSYYYSLNAAAANGF